MTQAHRVRSLLASATRTVRFLAPVALLALLTPGPGSAASPQSAAPAPAPEALTASGDEVASVRRDVRLRKLHLVRPDLIQYPLSYDVFC